MSSHLELVKASGVKKRRGEERQDYLKRVVVAIQSIDEDKWDDIGEAAKEFYNSMATAAAANESIPDFNPNFKGDGNVVKKTKKTAKTTKASKPAKASKASTSSENQEGEEAPAKKRQKGAQQMIKKIVLGDPKLPIDEVCQKVEKEGFDLSRSSVVSIRGGFLDSMRVIEDAGRLKRA